MMPFVTLIIALQIYSIYHAYQNNADSKWFWIIGFVPLIGSVAYLFSGMNTGTQGVVEQSLDIKKPVNSSQDIDKLKDAVEFADSISNNTKLADKYLELGKYKEAIKYYEKCVNRFHDDDDSDLWMKLVEANFGEKNYDQVIFYGEKLDGNRDFEDSEERICLAWAYYHTGNRKNAEENFKGMDQTLTNYTHRIQYAFFMKESGKKEDAMGQLNLLMNEYNQMKPNDKSLKKDIFLSIKSATLEISNS